MIGVPKWNGFVYATLSWNWFVKTWKLFASSDYLWYQTKKDVISKYMYFILVTFSSRVKLSKIVFLVWNFVQSSKLNCYYSGREAGCKLTDKFLALSSVAKSLIYWHVICKILRKLGAPFWYSLLKWKWEKLWNHILTTGQFLTLWS